MSSKGFLGLGNTGFGNFIGDIWEGAGDIVDRGSEVLGDLPGDVQNFADQLANTIYGAPQRAQQSETAQEFEQEAREYYAGQTGRQIGQQANNMLTTNNLILLVVGAAAIFFISRNS